MNTRIPLTITLIVAAIVCTQCGSTAGVAARERSANAFATVYRVLQHPRCLNCHPAGNVPLQGDDSRPHAQNVQSGSDGKGLYALRCSTCHHDGNNPGAHLPPGAPNWHLPHPSMPLVFQGRSPAELARQLVDRAHNGNRTPADILHHVTEDPLVLWGWAPGDGRSPVPVSHAEFVTAMRAWIDGGCQVPR